MGHQRLCRHKYDVLKGNGTFDLIANATIETGTGNKSCPIAVNVMFHRRDEEQGRVQVPSNPGNRS